MMVFRTLVLALALAAGIGGAARAAPGPPASRVEVLPVGPLIGEAIRRLSANGSITDLLGSPG